MGADGNSMLDFLKMKNVENFFCGTQNTNNLRV